MWGLVNSPVRKPACDRNRWAMRQVLPLPLVPATWMHFKPASGFPKRARSSCVVSNPGRIPATIRPMRRFKAAE